jgi:hypothetical protein
MKISIFWKYAERKFPYSDNTWNARKFEYLSEFEVKIKNTSDGYSGAQMGSFGQISLKWEISYKCTFKVVCWREYNNALLQQHVYEMPNLCWDKLGKNVPRGCWKPDIWHSSTIAETLCEKTLRVLETFLAMLKGWWRPSGAKLVSECKGTVALVWVWL